MTSGDKVKALRESMPFDLARLIPRSRGSADDVCDMICHGDSVFTFTPNDKRQRRAIKAIWQEGVEEKWQVLADAWKELGIRVTLEFPSIKGGFKTYTVTFMRIAS